MKISDLKVNAAAIEAGAWIDNIPELGTIRLKVRGVNNSDCRRMQSRLIETIPRGKREGGRIDIKDQDAITAKCLAHTVLVDWDGLTDDDGAPIPFSTEKALELLGDDSLRPFRDGVVWAASEVAHTEGENLTADEGNSATA